MNPNTLSLILTIFFGIPSIVFSILTFFSINHNKRSKVEIEILTDNLGLFLTDLNKSLCEKNECYRRFLRIPLFLNEQQAKTSLRWFSHNGNIEDIMYIDRAIYLKRFRQRINFQYALEVKKLIEGRNKINFAPNHESFMDNTKSS